MSVTALISELGRAAATEIICVARVLGGGVGGYQLSRARLTQRGHRQEAAQALRIAHMAMARLGSRALAERILNLAAPAHIPLEQPLALDRRRRQAPAAREADGLTVREREVLEQIVAGRTYAEIARDLFVSESTVGVHVSNLLHKTGTRSRIDLAARVTAQRGSQPR